MRRWLTFIFAGLALLLAGYRIARLDESSPSVTVTAPAPSSYTPATTTPTSAAAPAGATPPPRYPIVHFTITDRSTNPVGTWPFTAQLVGISENPNGFPGSDTIPPQTTYLMVQVAITSQITGRTTVLPEPQVSCHGPNDHDWSDQGNDGYDEGSSTAPDQQGANVAMGDGQPHLWDAQWQVPQGTSTTSVKCVLVGGTNYRLYSWRIAESGKLN